MPSGRAFLEAVPVNGEGALNPRGRRVFFGAYTSSASRAN